MKKPVREIIEMSIGFLFVVFLALTIIWLSAELVNTKILDITIDKAIVIVLVLSYFFKR